MPGFYNAVSYSPESPSTNKVPIVQGSAYKPLLNNGNLKYRFNKHNILQFYYMTEIINYK